jgi:hypothetical protein
MRSSIWKSSKKSLTAGQFQRLSWVSGQEGQKNSPRTFCCGNKREIVNARDKIPELLELDVTG